MVGDFVVLKMGCFSYAIMFSYAFLYFTYRKILIGNSRIPIKNQKYACYRSLLVTSLITNQAKAVVARG